MAVDDLWYLKKRDPKTKKLIPSKRHGRGKRWRVRYVDANGTPGARFFERKVDAESWDVRKRAGLVDEPKPEQGERRLTFREYAERWQTSRSIGQALDYQRHIGSRLKHHLYPRFGKKKIAAITVTDVLEWIAGRLEHQVAQTSMRTYFDLLNAIMNAAVIDRVATDNPCKGVRLSAILRGLSRAPKWVPTTDEVLALLDVVPDEFRAAIWLGAGEGLRLGEVLGTEAGDRCADVANEESHVVQQLRFHKATYDGFYLAPPKSGSVGDVELDGQVAEVLAEHVRRFPPTIVKLPDITAGTPDPGKPAQLRPVPLLFTDDNGDRSTTSAGRPCGSSGGETRAGPTRGRSTRCATTTPRL